MPTDDEAVELLNDREFDLYRDNERAAVARGRAKAWAEHRANGPTGKLRELSCGSVGNTALLEGYTRTDKVSSLIAAVSLSEGVQFSSKVERSLIDGSVIGVRVTLVAFTR